MGKIKGTKNIKTLENENKEKVNKDSMAYKILTHMRKYGSITTQVALKKYGANHFGQNIAYLKQLGYNVQSNGVKINGVHCKEYFLGEEKIENPQEDGLIIIEETQTPKPLKHIIKDYLIEHGEISVEKAINEFGWHRIRQYINEFRYKGMPIKSVHNGKYTTYVLEREKFIIAPPKEKELKQTNEVFVRTKKEEPKIMRVQKTQKEAVLEHLSTYGKITSIEARDLYNCTCLSAIIKYLKDDGYKITTTKDRCYKSQNTKVDRLQACAVYTMESTKRTKNQFIIVGGFNMAYSYLCPNYNGIFEKFDDAFNEAQKAATEMKNKLNNIVDSDNIQFCNRSVGDVVCIIKVEKVKKFFRTKIKETEVARFTIIENTVEV